MAHVLVVDDEDAIRRALGRVLRRSHTFCEASNIEDAKRILETEKIEHVVSDLMMPGGTGLDLFMWVKANQPALADRFIICSGGGPQEILDKVTESGVTFLWKPVEASEILQRLTPSEPASPSSPR